MQRAQSRIEVRYGGMHSSALIVMPWILDYSWAQRQGPWTTRSDTLLECQVHTKAPLSGLLAPYLATLRPGEQCMRSGPKVRGYWSGGVFLYLTARQHRQDPAQPIWMHSRGEDAMDSLAWVSRSICEALNQSRQCQGLHWVEHPHERNYRTRVDPLPDGNPSRAGPGRK